MQAETTANTEPWAGPAWRRWWVVIHLALALALAPRWLAALVSDDVSNDFTVFHSAWSLIARGEGASLYDAEAQGRVQRAAMGGRAFAGGVMAFLHPPHTAYLLSPLARLPLVWAFRLWTLFQLCCLVALTRTLVQVAGDQGRAAWWWRIGLFAFWPIVYGMEIGQVSLPLSLAAAVLVARAHAPVPAGLALAAMCLKPQTALFAGLWLMLFGDRRAFAVTLAVLATLAALASHGLGVSVWADYLAALPTLERHWGSGTPDFMHNLRSVLVRVLPGDELDSLSVFVTAAWLLGAFFFVAWARGQHCADKRAFAAALVLGLWLSPHAFPQDLAFLPVAAAAWRAQGRAQPASSATALALFLALPIVTISSPLLDRGLPMSLTTAALLALSLATLRPTGVQRSASAPAGPA